MRNTEHLKEYTEKDLIRARDDAQKIMTNGKLIGRVHPYLEVIRDINAELVKRLR